MIQQIKDLPEVLAASAELRKINSRERDEIESSKLSKLLEKNKKKIQQPTIGMSKRGEPMTDIMKGNLLLHTHVLRDSKNADDLLPALKKDIDDMLCHVPDLMEGLIEMSHQRKFVNTTFHAIKFSQCLVQAIWLSSSPFMQLPGMDDELIANINKGKKKNSNLFASFIRDPLAYQSALQVQDKNVMEGIASTCNVIPHMKVDYKLFVEDEENDNFYDDNEELGEVDAGPSKKGSGRSYDPNISKKGEVIKGDSIYEGDLVTLRVTMNRENVTEGSKAPMVHAPFFPRAISEVWWLILTDTSSSKKHEVNIHAVERITDQSKIVTHEIRFMAPNQVGDFKMELNVLCEAYAGIDQIMDIEFTVLSSEDLPEYEAHPEV